jgi:hypothetical protein
MSTLLINIGRQSDGCTYQLNPKSRAEVRRRFPGVRSVPSIFVGYETRSEFESIHGPMWKQIAMMLSGLTWEQIEEMGGVSMYDPMASEVTKVA